MNVAKFYAQSTYSWNMSVKISHIKNQKEHKPLIFQDFLNRDNCEKITRCHCSLIDSIATGFNCVCFSRNRICWFGIRARNFKIDTTSAGSKDDLINNSPRPIKEWDGRCHFKMHFLLQSPIWISHIVSRAYKTLIVFPTNKRRAILGMTLTLSDDYYYFTPCEFLQHF